MQIVAHHINDISLETHTTRNKMDVSHSPKHLLCKPSIGFQAFASPARVMGIHHSGADPCLATWRGEADNLLDKILKLLGRGRRSDDSQTIF